MVEVLVRLGRARPALVQEGNAYKAGPHNAVANAWWMYAWLTLLWVTMALTWRCTGKSKADPTVI